MKTWKEETKLTDEDFAKIIESGPLLPAVLKHLLNEQQGWDASVRAKRLLITEMVRLDNPELHKELREFFLKHNLYIDAKLILIDKMGVPLTVVAAYRWVYLI